MPADDTELGAKPFHYEGGIPVFEARLGNVERKASEAETRDEEYKNRQVGINFRLMVFTGLLVLTSLITGGISIWQAIIANTSAQAARRSAATAADTLKEIQQSSTDTHELAVQAKNQADRTRDIAVRALAQANATNALAREAKRSADIAERNLQTSIALSQGDKRPYVWPGEITPLPVKVGEPISAHVYFVNYGRTPAIKEKAAGEILTFWEEKDLMKHADGFFAIVHPNDMVGGSGIIIPPGIPPDARKSQAQATIESPFGPTNVAGVEEINKTDFSFAIVGRVTYFDQAGNYYWSDFCILHLATGLLAWCGMHNEIH